MSINFYLELKKNLQGELRENFDLSKSNWLGIGGKANFFFKPKDLKDLQIFLKNLVFQMYLLIRLTLLQMIGKKIILRKLLCEVFKKT